MIRLAIAALFCLSSGAGLAQDIDCAEAVTQLEMTFCAEMEWMAADDDLNDAYGHARVAMKAIDRGLPAAERGAETSLRDAQRAWITFRDAACAAEGYSAHGGSAEPMVIYFCRARLTEQRADDLWALAQE